MKICELPTAGCFNLALGTIFFISRPMVFESMSLVKEKQMGKEHTNDVY